MHDLTEILEHYNTESYILEHYNKESYIIAFTITQCGNGSN